MRGIKENVEEYQTGTENNKELSKSKQRINSSYGGFRRIHFFRLGV